jgi:transposase
LCETRGMKPYSKDLRLKVLAAVDRGMPRAQAARVFGVSVSTIKRYLRLRRETGDVEPKPVPGPEARKGAALDGALPAQARANPDLTLEEHCELFEEAEGMRVSTATMSRAFARLGLPLKKSPSSRPSATKKSTGTLARAGEEAGGRPPRVRRRVRDAHEHDAPPCAGAARREGLRSGAAQPRQEHHALGEHDLLRDGAVPGGSRESTTKEVFEAYVERVLAPSLRPGQVVVLDNLGAHKGERARELVEARGCELLFLPPYSPDFSPIEEAFSKVKAFLKKAEARTREALWEAMGLALDAVRAPDARGWFAHCGYTVGDQGS